MTGIIEVIQSRVAESCLERGRLEKQSCEVYIDHTSEQRVVIGGLYA